MKAYRDWIVSAALPTWATLGFDADAGRFRERLDLGGRPIDVPHRAMVQARQIYVFAHAASLGWFPKGEALARTALASLWRDFRSEDGGRARYAFSINADRSIASAKCDAYTHAFILFALSWMHRLTGDAALLDEADRVIATIEADLADPAHGGLYDAWPIDDRTKRQNPLMHLLEAYLFLDAAAPGRGYLERAGGIVALFRDRMFKPPGVLLEYFAEDWAPHPDAARAGLFEPGHHFEWVWLLAEYGRRSGTDQQAWTDPLYRIARAHGAAPNGLIYDELDIGLVPVTRSHRIWPHTEAIKAATARAAAADPDAPAFGEDMAAHLLEHFLDRPFAGGWIDHLDAGLKPKVDYVPASSLYHLFLAAAEAAGVEADPSPVLLEQVR